MKLDKIKFALLCGVVVNRGAMLMESDIAHMDSIIDIEIPEAQAVYPPANHVEALMKHMAGGTNKIDAIREHSAITGMGLKESKETVERYWPNKEKTANDMKGEMYKAIANSDYSEVDAALLTGFIARF